MEARYCSKKFQTPQRVNTCKRRRGIFGFTLRTIWDLGSKPNEGQKWEDQIEKSHVRCM